MRKTYHCLSGSGVYSTDTPVCKLLASGKAQEASPMRGEVAAILALDNAFISALRYVCQNSGGDIKKTWNRRCCLFHELRLSHCPLLLNRQRQSPRRYEYKNPMNHWDALRPRPIGDAYRHIPRTSTVAISKTVMTVICEIPVRLEQSVK